MKIEKIKSINILFGCKLSLYIYCQMDVYSCIRLSNSKFSYFIILYHVLYYIILAFLECRRTIEMIQSKISHMFLVVLFFKYI